MDAPSPSLSHPHTFLCPCRFTAAVSLPHRSDEFSVPLLKALESALVDFALDEPDGALDHEDAALVSSPISTYFKVQTADTDDEDDDVPNTGHVSYPKS